ncbi:MAG: dTMP kinase, partial [Lentisphaeria bacterium]|nr:dTMP kinase [Lentisphaeria bacterium]
LRKVRHTLKGYFITFEGAEGCGKSTQITLLGEALKKAGRRVTVSRSPGGTVVAEKIRKLLKEPTSGEDLEPETELLLFGACHSQMTANLIKPVLAKGGILLSDRFYDSTIAYQGYARNLGVESVKWINTYACRNLKPDLTILLDMDPVEGIRRARERAGSAETLAADRFDSEKLSFHHSVRNAFLRLAGEEPERFAVIAANGSIQEVHNRILEAVHAHLGIL